MFRVTPPGSRRLREILLLSMLLLGCMLIGAVGIYAVTDGLLYLRDQYMQSRSLH